jgi:hypothetical protein
MRYNGKAMSLSDSEAFQRLVSAARAVNAGLVVDRGSVHWIEDPMPGISYGLALGDAHALLFMPAADIAEPGWEQRLPQRIESAYHYLKGFPTRAR